MSDEIIKNPNRGKKVFNYAPPAHLEMGIEPDPIFEVNPNFAQDPLYEDLPEDLKHNNVIINNGSIDNDKNANFSVAAFKQENKSKDPLYILLDCGKIITSGSKQEVLNSLKYIENLKYKIFANEIVVLKQIDIRYDIVLE